MMILFTVNDREKKLTQQLQRQAEIPEVVLQKAQDAYRQIESGQVGRKQKISTVGSKRHWGRKAAGFATGFAAAAAVGFVVCAVNPVMAKDLPLVGGLFERLQDQVSFFGNFSDKATVLEDQDVSVDTMDGSEAVDMELDKDGDSVAVEDTDGENGGASESPKEGKGGVYSKTCDGLTITFSEVYANDQAIYLTMMAKSEEPFPDTEIWENDNGMKQPIMTMDFEKQYSFLESGEGDGYTSVQPEGVFLDNHTYSCILRLDLAEDAKDYSEYYAKYDEMVQQVLNELGISEDELDDSTEEGYALLEKFNDMIGKRNGSLRRSDYVHSVPVPEEFNLHLNINRFVGNKADADYWDSGYSETELENMSDEEYSAVMAQMPEEYNQYPNAHQNYWYEGGWEFDIPVCVDNSQTEVVQINETNEAGIGLESVVKTPYEITVNDLYEEGGNSNTILVALDANGNLLPSNDSNGSVNNFAIQDRDISTVDIYILDWDQYMNELKGEERFNGNENKPEEEKWSTLLAANAKYHKTICFE